ncbi:unnamed protein product [Candidula unifasciata]|uniref:Signal peptidase complex subunit 3 n=1 Tax=Candidula unifasciata TaxID=100452 RepID=A0A8S3YY33_9EUPU|nr:unnamed protein product [Candidula unifasciata]
MNSFTSRLNSLFAFTLSVMAALTFLCFLSTFFNDHIRPVDIKVGKVTALNQVVLWDKIIERGEESLLDYHSANTKYYFWDYGNGLRGHENVTLTLSWNVIPNAGTLPKVTGAGSERIVFPDQYTSGRF